MAGFDQNTLAISIRQGETSRFVFTNTRTDDGSPIDITGEKFVLTVKKAAKLTSPVIMMLMSGITYPDPIGSNPYDAAAAPTVSSVGVVNGPQGKWSINLSAIKTRSLPAGDYVYEVDKIKGDGSVRTMILGDFTVVGEVG